ncbi:MAG: hypothetical protein F4Z28_10480 [Gammaproteobacteria bacterium]|nr:hypothetical protein [Gammaproteobacteria bacterium]
MKPDTPEIAHDRVVALDLEIARLGAKFTRMDRNGGPTEVGMPGERSARVQIRGRIVCDLAQRDPAEIGESARVFLDRGTKHLARLGNPLLGSEGQVADTVGHRRQHNRMVPRVHKIPQSVVRRAR